MSYLYWIALGVVVWCWYAAIGTRGHLRVVVWAGGTVTVAALLAAASGTVARDNRLLLALFALGTCAFGYAIVATVVTTRRPNA